MKYIKCYYFNIFIEKMNQPYSINEYDQLLTDFCLRTIPNTYFGLKLIKGCGYSEILIAPKYYTIRDLLKLISAQFGSWTDNTVYYMDVNNKKVYINELSHHTPIRDLIRNLKWAYSVDSCIHNVHILYYGKCECALDNQCDECVNS